MVVRPANISSLQKSKFRYQDIFVELPVTIHNSHLLTSFLHQLPQQLPKSDTIDLPTSLADISRDPKVSLNPLVPNGDALDLAIRPAKGSRSAKARPKKVARFSSAVDAGGLFGKCHGNSDFFGEQH